MIFDVPQLLVYFACVGMALLLAVIGSALGLGEVTAKGKVTLNSPVEIIKGIGPDKAKRLKEHGVKTVGDLLNADPKKLGDAIKGISSNQIARWQEEAREAVKEGEKKKVAKKKRKKGGK
ncbi:MAG: helix-hairpin-helix domain-containing protein [Candidatus Freyarchaeota archaeon]|nr:helix-hairpin-helix domain-containing protein [Candidatus Jordarchaeia archaeon]